MTNIESRRQTVNQSAETVFRFLSDCNNFRQLISSSRALDTTTDSVSFTTGIGRMGMIVTGRTPNTKVSLASDAQTAIKFVLDANVTAISDTQCNVQLLLRAELNAMQRMFAMKPLTEFANSLVEKLATAQYY